MWGLSREGKAGCSGCSVDISMRPVAMHASAHLITVKVFFFFTLSSSVPLESLARLKQLQLVNFVELSLTNSWCISISCISLIDYFGKYKSILFYRCYPSGSQISPWQGPPHCKELVHKITAKTRQQRLQTCTVVITVFICKKILR